MAQKFYEIRVVVQTTDEELIGCLEDSYERHLIEKEVERLFHNRSTSPYPSPIRLDEQTKLDCVEISEFCGDCTSPMNDHRSWCEYLKRSCRDY